MTRIYYSPFDTHHALNLTRTVLKDVGLIGDEKAPPEIIDEHTVLYTYGNIAIAVEHLDGFDSKNPKAIMVTSPLGRFTIYHDIAQNIMRAPLYFSKEILETTEERAAKNGMEITKAMLPIKIPKAYLDDTSLRDNMKKALGYHL